MVFSETNFINYMIKKKHRRSHNQVQLKKEKKNKATPSNLQIEAIQVTLTNSQTESLTS